MNKLITILCQPSHSKFIYSSATEDEIKKSEEILITKFQAEDISLKRDPRVLRKLMSTMRSLYIKDRQMLPTGFIEFYKAYLEKENIKYEVQDLRKFPSVDKEFVKKLHANEVVTKNNLKPKDYQIQAVLAILKSKSGGCIQTSTGSGKSLIAYLLTQVYNKSKILFIFDSIDLIVQTRNMFIEYGMNENEINVIQGVNYQDEGRITLLSDKSYEKAFHLFPLQEVIIGDEIHSTGRTATCQKILYCCQNASVRIGLSATAFHENPFEHLKLIGNIGPIIYEKNISDQIADGHLEKTRIEIYNYKADRCHITGQWGDFYEEHRITKAFTEEDALKLEYKIAQNKGHIVARKFRSHGDESTHIVYNEVRNNKIKEIAEKLMKDNKRVLIVFSRIDHGVLLQKLIKNSILIHGSHSIKERQQAEKSLMKNEGTCVISSNIWSKGKNLPALTHYINASGGVSKIRVIQKAGRVTRKSEDTGKDEAVVIDFNDEGVSNIGKRQTRKRTKVYRDLKLPIKIVGDF